MIVLDLPKPLSVNRTRRIDWSATTRIRAWVRQADALVMSQGKLPERISGQFEAIVIYPENSRLDADNGAKGVLDFARRLELISDDSPKYMRRVTLEFGEAPEGCRLILKPWVEPAQPVEGFTTIGQAGAGVVSSLAAKFGAE